MSKTSNECLFIGWPQNRTERYKSIIQVLSEQPEKWHSITEIQDKIILQCPDVFNMDVSKQKYAVKKASHKPITSYLFKLIELGLVELSTGRNIHDNADIRKYKISNTNNK